MSNYSAKVNLKITNKNYEKYLCNCFVYNFC